MIGVMTRVLLAAAAYGCACAVISWVIGSVFGLTAQYVAMPFFFIGGLFVGHQVVRAALS